MPSGRRHDIHLKEGIEYSRLEELNDDFVRKLDKKSYGGDRFVRIIGNFCCYLERSLGIRLQSLSGRMGRDHEHRSRDH